MRASRLISLVLLLQSRERMTAAELARELEVSERTVYRDVEALSAAGVPVYAEQGRGGGYRLVGGYRTRLTGLSREEAEALFLSGLPGPAEDMGLADAVAAAELKVLAALPAALRDAPERTGGRFHLDAPGWFGESAPPPVLRELTRAVWRDEVVRFRYRRGREETVARTVEPYGLVLKNGTWYLVARVPAEPRPDARPEPGPDARSGERRGGRPGGGHRTYRVDRIADLRPGGERFDRDEGFDLPGYWAVQAEGFLRAMFREEVTIRLSSQGRRMLRYAVEPSAARRALEDAGAPDPDGWAVTTLPVESLAVAGTELLKLGAEVEVLDPPGLRAMIAETAARVAALYR
ncbi:WYL domain-containing protein [Actinomadura viridis]|uniref:DNA-binding transcriptional regulator YafY n=1 Tax=Actinomadura viridis TaxID=58110 RepID=A0A931DIF4_9ACTN|nr:YafY family protein [Actinomadura viridis]MBG6089304.1 putative DNA-binding transcriptional regulator YafY [Actinomadura viridis]